MRRFDLKPPKTHLWEENREGRKRKWYVSGTCGVPRGAVLDPILFPLYSYNMKRGKIMCHEDDPALYFVKK